MADGAARPEDEALVAGLPRLAELRVGARTVAEYRDGAGLEAVLAPRPFLHPVRTLAGVLVSDAIPADHRWHLGVGVAIQDVGGTNLWGGRTYVRDAGYTWLGDHGRVRQAELVQPSPGSLSAELDWLDRQERPLLRETRLVQADPVDAPDAWWLRFRFELSNVSGGTLRLGSPGSNGRPGGGYGGFFWRLPPLTAMSVHTPDAAGEDAVHGRTAPWLAVHGRAGLPGPDAARDGSGGDGSSGVPVTLVFRAADEQTRRDPWFVRVSGYPGVGSSLAAQKPVILEAEQSVRRSIDVLVADGTLNPSQVWVGDGHP